MRPVVVIGAGIVGVSAALWLARAGRAVTLVDRLPPGQGTSYGNAGLLARSAIVPVTTPGLTLKAPRYLLDPNFPLFLRWAYLPRLLPWLVRYLSHATDAETRRIAGALLPIIGDAVEQHEALARGTGAARFLALGDYVYAYRDRAAFRADAYSWALRAEAGFVPEIVEGAGVRARDPAYGPGVGCLAVLRDHGYVRDPGGYVAALAAEVERAGGTVRQAGVRDFTFAEGRVAAVETDAGPLPCEAVILATGAWSGPLMRRLGLRIPLESERGYHVVFRGAEGGPTAPTMVAAGKFVATPMAEGLRCAGIVEFGGLEAGPSRAPFALLRREVRRAFPGLTAEGEVEWQGHRPAPSDSIPLIGEVGRTGVYAGFGHHHVGLTGGPKTGRLLAQMLTGQTPNIDMAPYAPGRFASG